MGFLLDFFKVLFGGWTKERPSPSDIVPKENISIIGSAVIVDYGKPLRIPFALPPIIVGAYDIPNTNSMDGFFDAGHNIVYIKPASIGDQVILVGWLAKEWTNSNGMLANDCVYRVMADPKDNPYDFTKSHDYYAIHRIHKVGYDDKGRYFKFKGINNSIEDAPKVRDGEILWLSTQIIF